jgi:serine/threonine protein kinase
VWVTIASHIGQYRILRKLGAGGMGLVFLGEHTLLGRRAAIKTLLPAMSANSEIVERFFNEARATSAISDPGIIQVFDFGYHVDGTAYIVMELLEGEALSARIARLGTLSLGDALRIARQIAGSLAAAHACDIVHRDLKPENIFLVADAEAQGGERTKILDFGICKLGTGDATLTQSGAMIGTPVYMSPEQCRGAGGVDCRSDIYAFGCLVFHMLAGRPPFVGEASGDLIVAHLEEEPPAPSLYVDGLPLEVDALVLRCLAKAPEDRFSSMSELQQLLGELYAGLEVPEAPVAPVTPAMPLGRGFRSLFDGNFASGGTGASSSARLRLPWMRGAQPRSTAMAAHQGQTPSSGDGSTSAVTPRRRAVVRVVLGGVVAAGLVLGMLATSAVLYGERGEAAEAAHPVARPIEEAPAEPAPRSSPAIAPPTSNPGETWAADPLTAGVAAPSPAEEAPVAEPVADRATPGTVAAAIERSRRQREAPRDMNRTVVRPRLRFSDPGERSAPAVTAPSAARPSQSPVLTVSTTAPAPMPGGSAAPPAPASAPTNPPSEDLYDTR